jgi:protein NrfD
MTPTEIVVQRHNALVDPHLEIWGWEVAAYLFLGGLVAGVMVFSALLAARPGAAVDAEAEPEGPRASRTARWLPFLAPVLLSVGMLCLLLDLENKAHAYRFYLAFQPTSPMSWGAWILVLIYPATLALGLARLTDGEVAWLRAWAPLRRTGLGALLGWGRRVSVRVFESLRRGNIALGLALGLYTGVLLGTVQARALWSSTMLAPLFLVSGLSAGLALLMLLPLGRSRRHVLGRWDRWAIGAELALLALFFLDRAHAGAVGSAQAARFFGGDLTAVFWSFVVLTGLLLPLAFAWLEAKRGLKPSVVAPLLVLLGGFLLRWMLLHAGQTPSA